MTLTAEQASAHRHAVGQLMFVGLDCADVQFTVKELGREMAQLARTTRELAVICATCATGRASARALR